VRVDFLYTFVWLPIFPVLLFVVSSCAWSCCLESCLSCHKAWCRLRVRFGCFMIVEWKTMKVFSLRHEKMSTTATSLTAKSNLASTVRAASTFSGPSLLLLLSPATRHSWIGTYLRPRRSTVKSCQNPLTYLLPLPVSYRCRLLWRRRLGAALSAVEASRN